MGTSNEVHFEDLRGLDLLVYVLVAGFLQKNFPASILQKYVFLVPFSNENYYHRLSISLLQDKIGLEGIWGILY